MHRSKSPFLGHKQEWWAVATAADIYIDVIGIEQLDHRIEIKVRGQMQHFHDRWFVVEASPASGRGIYGQAGNAQDGRAYKVERGQVETNGNKRNIYTSTMIPPIFEYFGILAPSTDG